MPATERTEDRWSPRRGSDPRGPRLSPRIASTGRVVGLVRVDPGTPPLVRSDHGSARDRRCRRTRSTADDVHDRFAIGPASPRVCPAAPARSAQVRAVVPGVDPGVVPEGGTTVPPEPAPGDFSTTTIVALDPPTTVTLPS